MDSAQHVQVGVSREHPPIGPLSWGTEMALDIDLKHRGNYGFGAKRSGRRIS